MRKMRVKLVEQSKVLGCLYGAAYGDSLGAVTEFCTHQEIMNHFPEGCHDYTDSISLITHGITPGSVTDDFGSSCYVMKTILKHQGIMNKEVALEAILDWSQDDIVFAKYAGQNTKESIARLKQGIVIDEMSKKRHFGRMNTNGGAMKAAPMGLLAQADFVKTIDYTLALCWPTHYNSAAASAACAIACAVCAAQREEASLDEIIACAIDGARIARKRLEKEDYDSFGPYVDIKIKEAVEAAKQAENDEDVIGLLNSSIGTGIWVQESIPAVFAIITAYQGDFMKSVHCAVNAGGDTDTIASMTGAIVGGYCGIEAVPQTAIKKIQTVNAYLDLEKIVDEYTQFLLGGNVK